MIERTVRGQAVYIRGTKCQMQIATLATGKLLIRIRGKDDGELGRIPFDELNARLTQGEVELFVDTSEATGVSNPVTEQWQKWFSTRRNQLKKVHIFATSKFFRITAGIIQELSGTRDLIQIYSDAATFQQAVGIQEWPPVDDVNLPDPADTPAGTRLFTGVLSRVFFTRLRPGVVFLKITGRDTGDTLEEVLGALASEIETFPGPLQIFVDASETTGVTPRVSESWTRWIKNHQNRLMSIDVLTNSRLVTLIVSAARIFSQTGDLLNVLDQRADFIQRIEQAAPGSEKLIS